MTDVSEQSVAEALNLAADLLDRPGAWTQNNFALNAHGRPVPATSDEAKCWCLDGALMRIKGTGNTYDELHAIADANGLDGAMSWNDDEGRTQAEVVAALRSASLLAAPRAGEGVDRG